MLAGDGVQVLEDFRCAPALLALSAFTEITLAVLSAESGCRISALATETEMTG
jgi:hypothetical protein